MSEMKRRTMLGAVAAGAALATAGKAQGKEKMKLKTYDNGHFYKDGEFQVDIAKAAYYEMMEFHNYPIVPRLQGEEFWATDFGLGKFSEIGMGGIFWVNNLEDNYFGHEIYLFNGQCIPEHSHVKTKLAGPKMEAWQVRYGSVWIYGEGEPTPGMKVPPTHKECMIAKTEKKLEPGEMGQLAGAGQWHWMKGGPNGGIVTEYATYHDNDGLRFSHPDIVF